MMTRQNERGVTMVELLVTISLLGLIAAALTSAMATGLRSTEQTQDTVLTSRDT